MAERQHQVVVRPTSTEIAKAERAMCWPATYLTGDECRMVQKVAFYRGLGKDLDHAALRMRPKARRSTLELQKHYKLVRDENRRGLDHIAACLR